MDKILYTTAQIRSKNEEMLKEIMKVVRESEAEFKKEIKLWQDIAQTTASKHRICLNCHGVTVFINWIPEKMICTDCASNIKETIW